VNVTESLSINGWGVARLDLERRFAPYGEAFADRVFLFRAPDCWPLLVLRHSQRDGAEGRSGHASVTLRRFESLDDLAAHVEEVYGASGWYELLEAGRDDPDLYTAWVPEWIPRAFDRASIFRKDLALSTGLLGGEAIPAPGRELDGWRYDALAQMAARLIELGFQVVDLSPAGSANPSEPEVQPFRNRFVGELRVRRDGVETTGLVRIDSAGEVYIRLPDNPTFTPLDDDEASS
jgi:hypothetical protein